MKLISACPFISVVLTPILTFSTLWAQSPASVASSPTPDAAAAQMLQVRLAGGEDSPVEIGSHAVKGFTVQVTDLSGGAVADAAVAFRLPDSGPTGAFADGSHSAVAYTDAAGRANIAGIQWATTPGLVAMRVTATKGTSHAGMLIEESLTARPSAVVAISAPGSAASAGTVATTDALSAPIAAPPPAPAQRATAQTVAKAMSSTQTPAAQVTGVQITSNQGTSSQTAAQQDTSAARTPATQLANQSAARQAQPSVSVSGAAPGQSTHSSHAKWIILLAIAAGAGIGVAMVGKGKGSSAAPATPSLSIGAPSISVGQPH